MASIRKRPRGDGTVNYSVLYLLNGRQSSLPFDSEKAAEAFKAAVDAHGAQKALEMHGLSTAPRRRTGLTVEQWVRRHIDHLTGVEQTTIDKYDDYLRNDIAPNLGHLLLAELDSEDIARWVKTMETTGGRGGTGHAPKTLANKYGFLSGALNAAVPKYLDSNPAAGRRLPRAGGNEDDDGDDGDMRMLSREEFAGLLTEVTPHWKLLIEFLVSTGLRWSEAVALQPRHVDQEASTVKVRQTWKYSRTKGYYLGPPKTKRSRRTVDVPASIMSRLDLSGEWVFVNRDGGPVRYHGFKRRVWDKAVTRAGLDDPRPGLHDLRHTYASWNLAGGVPITVVSRQLGHESIQITVDTYTDVDRASSRAAADLMEKLLTAD